MIKNYLKPVQAIMQALCLVAMFGLLFSCSASKGRDMPIIQAGGHTTGVVPVWTRPGEMNIEIGSEQITGSAKLQQVFGYSWSDDDNSLTSVVNRSDLDVFAQTAAARAVATANADGIYVTSVVAETEGFFPGFREVKYTVKGHPVKYKGNGIMSADRADLRHRFQTTGYHFGR